MSSLRFRRVLQVASHLVTHDALLDAVWTGAVVEPQAVKKHILSVRSALGDRPKKPQLIETVPKKSSSATSTRAKVSLPTRLLPDRQLLARIARLQRSSPLMSTYLTSTYSSIP